MTENEKYCCCSLRTGGIIVGCLGIIIGLLSLLFVGLLSTNDERK